MERIIGVKQYVEELLTEGKVDDRPKLRCGPNLFPTYVIKREPKFFIATQLKEGTEWNDGRPELQEEASFGELRFVYFPTNSEHAVIFSKSNVKRNGPQKEVPGSVAILDLEYDIHTLHLGPLQYCFKQGLPRELSRQLATRYLGARYRLLETLTQHPSFSSLNMVPSGAFKSKKENSSTLEAVLRITHRI